MSNSKYLLKNLQKEAKDRGIKYSYRMNKTKLIDHEVLGLELKQPTNISVRSFKRTPREIIKTNDDGSEQIFKSISSAAKTLGVYPMQIYELIAFGHLRFGKQI